MREENEYSLHFFLSCRRRWTLLGWLIFLELLRYLLRRRLKGIFRLFAFDNRFQEDCWSELGTSVTVNEASTEPRKEIALVHLR